MPNISISAAVSKVKRDISKSGALEVGDSERFFLCFREILDEQLIKRSNRGSMTSAGGVVVGEMPKIILDAM